MSVPVACRRHHYHTTDANTVALWQGFGDKLDSSGNGLTLTLAAGTERYAEIANGLQGFAFDGATHYNRAGNDAVLNLAGDMTIEAIVRPHVGTFGQVITYIASGETGGNDNGLWSMACAPATQAGLPAMASAVLMDFFWESGVGVNQDKSGVLLCPINQPMHWAWVRTGTTLIPYVNGFAQPSITGITNGTLGGAPTQTVRVGADLGPASIFTGVIASIKISNVARSAGYILKDAMRTLGLGTNLSVLSPG